MTTCPFCGCRMPAVPIAIDEGWIPSYVKDGEEEADPVCPACVASRLRRTEYGDFEVAPAHPALPGCYLK